MKKIIKNNKLINELKIITNKINSIRKNDNLYYSKNKYNNGENFAFMDTYKDEYKDLYKAYKETKKLIKNAIEDINNNLSLTDKDINERLEEIYNSDDYYKLNLIHKEYIKIDDRYNRFKKVYEKINERYNFDDDYFDFDENDNFDYHASSQNKYIIDLLTNPRVLNNFIYIDEILSGYTINDIKAFLEGSAGMRNRIDGLLAEVGCDERDYYEWRALNL